MSLVSTVKERPPMAKKKAAPKRTGRPPLPKGQKSVDRYAFRTSEAWKEWFGNFADFLRRDKADVAQDAIEEFAKLRGFPEPPPKR